MESSQIGLSNNICSQGWVMAQQVKSLLHNMKTWVQTPRPLIKTEHGTLHDNPNPGEMEQEDSWG